MEKRRMRQRCTNYNRRKSGMCTHQKAEPSIRTCIENKKKCTRLLDWNVTILSLTDRSVLL